MPPVAPVEIPMAIKGDLMPIGCIGPFLPDTAAECMDTAYEVASVEPSLVVETRMSNSSILMRMLGYTTALFQGDDEPRSE
jgi:hypothetical protein